MIRPTSDDVFVTSSFRKAGYLGAALFTLAPPAFLYEMYLIFYTTEVEESPNLWMLAALTLLLAFLSVPLLMIGRRRRYSALPSLAVPGAGLPADRQG